jgi:hypothetical protein
LIGEIIAVYRAEQGQAPAKTRFTPYCGRYCAPIFDLDFLVRVSRQFGLFKLAAALESARSCRWPFPATAESSDWPLFSEHWYFSNVKLSPAQFPSLTPSFSSVRY